MTITERGYELVVGLEVHCELRTATKLFCGCANVFGAEPNHRVCPVCLGLPGSLPVLNERAVELAIRVGTALHCRIEPSIFHRKNYFYPDMPKDYQISQYDQPIDVDGYLDLPSGARIGIERAHLEEDTGKTTHRTASGAGGRIHDADYSLVDYNRAGVPLLEIVSRPDLRSAADARAYVAELRGILLATGASDGRMEEGSLRVDANVSVRRIGETALGTRCEVKNMNSLRSLTRAIDHEADRQVGLIVSGEVVAQETRHFNEAEGRTSALRSKEEAFDYRYFPEPDLVPLVPEAALLGRALASMPPLPAERRQRLVDLLVAAGSPPAPDLVATVVDLELDELVIGAVDAGAPVRLVLNRVANEAASDPVAARRLAPAAIAELCRMEHDGELGASQAKAVLAAMLNAHVAASPREVASSLGLAKISQEALAAVLDGVIGDHPSEWARYVAGEAKVAQFLLGQVMRATQGRADGKAVAALMRERSSAG